MTTRTRIQGDYPRTITLGDGRAVSLRLMTRDDVDTIVSFARGLPEEDLLFLRLDITDPDEVAAWAGRQEAGRSTTLLAEANGDMLGYVSLIHNEVAWQRHVGEIRVVVGTHHRGRGLGRALAAEIFALARELGLRKLIAQMTAGQKAAINTFKQFGFQPEALLQDLVIDRTGRTRDLVIMSYDVEGLTDRAD